MLDISVEAKSDNSVFKGNFETKGRILETDGIEEDVSKMFFTPKITNHNETCIAVNLVFETPEELSIGGRASVAIQIKENSVLKSKKTLKPIDSSSFRGKVSELNKVFPPLIHDPEAAGLVKNMTL